MLEGLNGVRAILVGLSAVAALVAVGLGYWVVALVLAAAIAAHGLLWWWLYLQRERDGAA